MRPHHLIPNMLAAVMLAGCPGQRDFIECVDDTSCGLAVGGHCLVNAATGHQFCAYPDPACPGGLRWSDFDVEDTISGACVAQEVDAGIDAPPDAATDAPAVGCPARIAFSDGAAMALEVYSANVDGTGVTNLSASPANDNNPNWARRGDLVAFDSNRTGANGDIFTVAAGGSVPRNVTQHPDDDRRPVFSPDGVKIAFARRSGATSTLWVVNVDGTGARELSTLPYFSMQMISWSPDGTRIAFVSNGVVHAVALAGGTTNLCAWSSGTCSNPAWSPDGARVAIQVYASNNAEVYVVNSNGANPVNVTNLPSADDGRPSWSPDGMWIAFDSNRRGGYEIYKSAFPVAGEPARLTQHDATITDTGAVWSPDGTRLAFVRNQPGGSRIATMTADGTSYAAFAVNANPSGPSWSPCP